MSLTRPSRRSRGSASPELVAVGAGLLVVAGVVGGVALYAGSHLAQTTSSSQPASSPGSATYVAPGCSRCGGR